MGARTSRSAHDHEADREVRAAMTLHGVARPQRGVAARPMLGNLDELPAMSAGENRRHHHSLGPRGRPTWLALSAAAAALATAGTAIAQQVGGGMILPDGQVVSEPVYRRNGTTVPSNTTRWALRRAGQHDPRTDRGAGARRARPALPAQLPDPRSGGGRHLRGPREVEFLPERRSDDDGYQENLRPILRAWLSVPDPMSPS